MRISDWSSDVCSSDLANAVVWTMIGAGLGLIAIYVWRSRTHAMPIVDLNLLRITSFRISTTGGSLYRVATGAYTLLMPLMRSEEHTSELQSLMRISYAVFCLKKKKQHNKHKDANILEYPQ